MSCDQFMYLRDVIAPFFERSQRQNGNIDRSFSVEIIRMVTLRILRGASYLEVSWQYVIAPSTFYSIFNETLQLVDHNLKIYISFPVTGNDCRQKSKTFREIMRSPLSGIITALNIISI